jgi:hypothetical protein
MRGPTQAAARPYRPIPGWTAAAVLALAGPALAANTVKLDISGTGQVTTLAIAQDAAHNSGAITTTGAAGGAQIPIRGHWDSISIVQNGAGESFASTGLTANAASTAASLDLTYGSSGTTGNNSHTLVIGNTTAPVNPLVTVDVNNTNGAQDANIITDSLNGASLTYSLSIDGTANSISNTLAVTGAFFLTETVSGGSHGAGNTITNSITGATSANVTLDVESDHNTVTNTSNGSGVKTISVNLPSGSNGNTVVQNLTGGTGSQTANFTVNGTTSKVNYGLTASGAGTTANVTLSDVVGAAGAAGKVTISQTGAGDNVGLTFNGNSFTMGSGLTGGAGILVTQSSPGAKLSATISAGANGYQASVSM